MQGLPKYKCNKVVEAVKILNFGQDDEGKRHIIADRPNIPPFPISLHYWNKHMPQIGGYYVRYEDGYESFSPAKSFEDGYSEIVKYEGV